MQAQHRPCPRLSLPQTPGTEERAGEIQEKIAWCQGKQSSIRRPRCEKWYSPAGNRKNSQPPDQPTNSLHQQKHDCPAAYFLSRISVKHNGRCFAVERLSSFPFWTALSFLCSSAVSRIVSYKRCGDGKTKQSLKESARGCDGKVY